MLDLKKMNSLSTKDENWLKEAKERQDNKDWQNHSRKIASKLLISLREKNIKQNQLAEMIGVSAQQVNKIVKGKENLTLETITKLEQALKINLIFEEQHTNYVIKEKVEYTKYVCWHVYTNKTEVIKKNQSFTELTSMNYEIYSEPLKAAGNGA